MKAKIWLAIAVFLPAMGGLAQGGTITVCWDGSGDYTTIQAGIDAAVNGDEVVICEGTYTGPGNRDLDFSNGLPEGQTRAITVRSTDPNDPAVIAATIIDCEGYGRGFNFHTGEGPNSVLAGLTITNGYAEDGCGININNSSPIITHCTITANSSDEDGIRGGGIYIRDGSPTIRYCRISENLFTGRSWGGGIYCYNSSPTITYCTITGNQVRDGGGGISCYYNSSPIISHCTISGNVVTFRIGGGILCHDGNPTITNCIIANNSSGDSGGGIRLYRSDATISECTITGNSDNVLGGGIYFELGRLMITNCILWGNTAPNGSEIGVYSWGGVVMGALNSGPEPEPTGVLTGSYCDVKDGHLGVYVFGEPDYLLLNWGYGNIDAEPCFVNPAAGNYHLKSAGWRWDTQRQVWTWDEVTSLCIDAGNPGSDLGDELLSVPGDPDNEWGENLRINMGAYGGTAQASMAPPGWALLADLNNDAIVDLADLARQMQDWLMTEDEQPGDLNRDGVVNGIDLMILVENWLQVVNRPPVVNITAPQDGAEFYDYETVEIEADAWDVDGSVVKVEFFANENKIGEDNDGSDGWKTNWQGGSGIFNLTAKATADNGATAISLAVVITVHSSGP